MVLQIVIFAGTAVILTILIWAQWQRWQDHKQAEKGITIIPFSDRGEGIGCVLGILGALGLVFVVTTLIFDLVENSDGPEWMAWVVAFGYLFGFIFFVTWAVIVSSSAFAAKKLMFDDQAIRLLRSNETAAEIYWHSPWQLEKSVHIQIKRQNRPPATYIYYTLMLNLIQNNQKILIGFNSNEESTAGLPRFEGDISNLELGEKTDWAKETILRRYKEQLR